MKRLSLFPLILLLASCSQGEVEALITFQDGREVEFVSDRVSAIITVQGHLQITATMGIYTMIILVADAEALEPPLTINTDFSEEGMAKIQIDEARTIEQNRSTISVETQEYNATEEGEISIGSGSYLEIDGAASGTFRFSMDATLFDDTLVVDDGNFIIYSLKEDDYNSEMVDNPVEGKNPEQ